MNASRSRGCLAVLIVCVVGTIAPGHAAQVDGELKRWHRVTLTFTADATSEQAATNPFLDRRLQVRFTHPATGEERDVAGFYAADGDAAETGAESGDRWRVHFTPDEVGSWTWQASFREGIDVALTSSPTAGQPSASIDGETGSFVVAETDKTGRDHRGLGILEYVGTHYLRFQGGDFFLKGGADSPENFLAYADFDQTFDTKNCCFLHEYAPHVGDWRSGDPTWKDGKGKGIIGALNYLSGKGMNSVYFITFNVAGGDGGDVWPWTSPDERFRFDVSKLDQWEIVFSHMDRMGIQLHFLTQETENDQALDGGDLGRQRQLYYREMIARFGHHPALVWNLGEENTNTTAQRKAFADYIRDVDPYDHPIVIHTYPGQQDSVYTPLLGHPTIEGPSIQTGPGSVHSQSLQWRTASAGAGRPWVVNSDEIGPANKGVVPDDHPDDPNHDVVRRDVLWGNLMAGGGGVEWYFGYGNPHNDLNCEDWRSRDRMWDQTRHALEFFRDHLPFVQMEPCDSLVGGSNYCLGDPARTYAVYLKTGGTTDLTLPDGAYSVRWFDPELGGALQIGSVTEVYGPGTVSIGSAPFGGDAAALIESLDPTDGPLAIATATPSVVVLPATEATLDGSGSLGDVVSWAWTQTSGDPAMLDSPDAATTLVWGLDLGVYEFQLEVTDAAGATDTATVAVRVDPADPAAGAVIGFILVDADTDQDIQPLADGAILDLATLPTANLNVRAVTAPPTVGSVRFALDANANFATENVAPYALAGDSGGDYAAWTPALGSHVLTATPYAGPNAAGTVGMAWTVAFLVRQDGGGSGIPAPTNLRRTDRRVDVAR